VQGQRPRGIRVDPVGAGTAASGNKGGPGRGRDSDLGD